MIEMKAINVPSDQVRIVGQIGFHFMNRDSDDSWGNIRAKFLGVQGILVKLQTYDPGKCKSDQAGRAKKKL